MSLCVRKPTVWVPTRSDTNWPVQSQEQARSLKFRIQEDGSYYPCSENKGADQLCSNAVTAQLICGFSPMQIVGYPMQWLKLSHLLDYTGCETESCEFCSGTLVMH